MLEAVIGHAKSARMKLKTLVPAEQVERVDANIVRVRVTEWKRVLVMTSGVEGGKRVFVLEPGDEENELVFGPFSVRGRFTLARKVNATQAAVDVWKAGDVA